MLPIYGSNANDLLIGGDGIDLLTGGGGNDFVETKFQLTTARQP
jgi:Ca2+-binding RTX toxin-like protein